MLERLGQNLQQGIKNPRLPRWEAGSCEGVFSYRTTSTFAIPSFVAPPNTENTSPFGLIVTVIDFAPKGTLNVSALERLEANRVASLLSIETLCSPYDR